jgi:hypothetical protein
MPDNHAGARFIPRIVKPIFRLAAAESGEFVLALDGLFDTAGNSPNRGSPHRGRAYICLKILKLNP